MVLFKFQRAIVKIALKRFTFHYGSIQIHAKTESKI